MMGIHKTLLSAVLILLVSAYYSYTEELYVVNSDTSEVLRYDGTTGAFIDAFVTPGSGGLLNVNGMVFGPNGNLDVSNVLDPGEGNMLLFDGGTGDFITVLVPDGVGGLSNPQDLVFFPSGPVLVPTLSQWALMAMAGILGIVGFMAIRRRKEVA